MSYLIDADALSNLRRPERLPPATAHWFRTIAADQQYLSVVTLMELEIGIRRKERIDPVQGAMLRRWKLERVLPAFDGRILAVSAAVAEACAAMHVPDRRQALDSLVAATALVHRMTVVTRNAADFEGLAPLFNPWALG